MARNNSRSIKCLTFQNCVYIKFRKHQHTRSFERKTVFSLPLFMSMKIINQKVSSHQMTQIKNFVLLLKVFFVRFYKCSLFVVYDIVDSFQDWISKILKCVRKVNIRQLIKYLKLVREMMLHLECQTRLSVHNNMANENTERWRK